MRKILIDTRKVFQSKELDEVLDATAHQSKEWYSMYQDESCDI
jgi:hypothetical protein